jgi:hypothetical protein
VAAAAPYSSLLGASRTKQQLRKINLSQLHTRTPNTLNRLKYHLHFAAAFATAAEAPDGCRLSHSAQLPSNPLTCLTQSAFFARLFWLSRKKSSPSSRLSVTHCFSAATCLVQERYRMAQPHAGRGWRGMMAVRPQPAGDMVLEPHGEHFANPHRHLIRVYAAVNAS